MYAFYHWRHRKTGHDYRIIGFCLIEKTLTPAVMYARVGELTTFIRPCDEFFDGRFRQVIPEMEKPEEVEPSLELQFLDGSKVEVEIERKTFAPINEESVADRAARAFAAKRSEAL